MLPDVIHYGAKVYDPELVEPIENREWVKPYGGLWTSPVDSRHSWKHWCDDEKFRRCEKENSFTLRFKEGTSVYIINSSCELHALPKIESSYFLTKFLPDFESISAKYDAIWLTEKGQWATRFSEPMNLYGWDCETIFIMNPNCCYQI